jgi:hypothetical protein
MRASIGANLAALFHLSGREEATIREALNGAPL